MQVSTSINVINFSTGFLLAIYNYNIYISKEPHQKNTQKVNFVRGQKVLHACMSVIRQNSCT